MLNSQMSFVLYKHFEVAPFGFDTVPKLLDNNTNMSSHCMKCHKTNNSGSYSV